MSGLSEALVSAQRDMPRLTKDSTAKIQTKSGGEYRYSYLSLDKLLDGVLPVLNAHGLMLWQAPVFHESGVPGLRTEIVHVSGDSIVSVMPLAVYEGSDPKAQGSAITYARRYAVLSMLGLAPDEDDDGAAAQPKQHAHPEARPSEGPPSAAERPASKGTLKYLAETVEALQKGFPSPDPDHKYADDVRRDVQQLGAERAAELSEEQVQTLVLKYEKQLIDAKAQEALPFG